MYAVGGEIVKEGSADPGFAVDGRQKLFVYLAAIFVSCLLLGDVIGGKTVSTPLGPMSVGTLPFPVTFLLTDIINDFYGRKGARFVTVLGFWMAVLAWCILQVSTDMTPDASTYFSQSEFQRIFGGSAHFFVASITAYLVAQWLDIQVFQYWKAVTESKHLWLRATGSTVLSQAVDTVIINVVFWSWTAGSDPSSFLARMEPAGRWAWILAKIGREYGFKLVVAGLLTPLVYALHGFIVQVMGIQPEAPEPLDTDVRFDSEV
jgi:uncharacterized integral membrane protein (TIGR00697 family)